MIPVFQPAINQEEIDAVTKVLKSKWIGLGSVTEIFEKDFARFIGINHAVGLNSGTAALHLAVKALNINSGEIIVPAITFVTTAFAATYNNATPVFADVYEDTLNIDVDDIKRKITSKTKAIIPVHFGGHAAEMDEINEIAKEHNLKVIEDAAHACGAKYKEKMCGSLSDVACFSFHPVKNLATCDGGMLTTNSKEIDEKVRILRWCGITKGTFERTKKTYSWYYEVLDVGYKYHMNDIIAAIGLTQLKKLKKTNERRREITKIYNENFQKLNWVETPVEKKYTKSSNHNYVIKVVKRDKFMDFLSKNGISTSVHYMPLHLHPVFKKIKANVPVAEKVWKKLVTLPLYPDMTDEEVDHVIKTVKSFSRLI
jgi:perosamine synthetase